MRTPSSSSASSASSSSHGRYGRRVMRAAACCALALAAVADIGPTGAHAQMDFDGGRSKLYGGQDKFDRFSNAGRPGRFGAPSSSGGGPSGPKVVECPQSDSLSAFSGVAFVDGDILVRLEDVPDQYLPDESAGEEETSSDEPVEEGSEAAKKEEKAKIPNPAFLEWKQEEATCQKLVSVGSVNATEIW